LVLVRVLVLVVLCVTLTVNAASARTNCVRDGISNLRGVVEFSEVILIGRVQLEDGGNTANVTPEAYLKGAASGEQVSLTRIRDGECPNAEFPGDGRALMFLTSSSGVLLWPIEGRGLVLKDGDALDRGTVVMRESELIARIRDITGQYAVPAASDDEGAGIDWLTTVLPVGAALAGIMIAGLILMRTWHRIDPS